MATYLSAVQHRSKTAPVDKEKYARIRTIFIERIMQIPNVEDRKKKIRTMFFRKKNPVKSRKIHNLLF